MVNAFTIDLEDWFHILDLEGAPGVGDWPMLESRVVKNTQRLMNLMDQHQVRGTFFVLGWIADHYPDLVKKIADEGHEIASHGYAHKLIYSSSQMDFESDILRSIDAIYRSCTIVPRGYRAPGFSLTKDCLWVFDVLSRNGFQYDSSIFPAARGHGGFKGFSKHIERQNCGDVTGIWEFPISVHSLFGIHVGFSGGGYLRLCPERLLERWIRQINDNGSPAMVYIHPRDLDESQPQLPMPLARKFKSYCNLSRTASKLDRLLDIFEFAPVSTVLRGFQASAETESSLDLNRSTTHTGQMP